MAERRRRLEESTKYGTRKDHLSPVEYCKPLQVLVLQHNTLQRGPQCGRHLASHVCLMGELRDCEEELTLHINVPAKERVIILRTSKYIPNKDPEVGI